MKVLGLTTEAYGGFGGVAVYNIDLYNALAELDFVSSIQILSRVVREEPEQIPAKTNFSTAATKGLPHYLGQCFKAMMRNDYDVILCSHIYLLPFAKLIRGFKKTPIVTVMYGVEAWVPTKRFLTDALLKKCDSIVSISDYTAERFSQWSGIAQTDIHLLPNAYHAAQFGIGETPDYLRDRYKVDGRKVILTLGRLDERERQKGMDELIDVFPTMLLKDPNLLFIIAGDGDDKSRLENKVKDKGLENSIIFAGRVSEEEKSDHYRLADVFSMVGRQEGFGFVFIEAMACGTPVVASTLDGSRYAVLHGKLGEVANPDDPENLMNALFKAFAKPRGIPEGLDFFSYDNFVKRLDKIMRPFVSGAPGDT